MAFPPPAPWLVHRSHAGAARDTGGAAALGARRRCGAWSARSPRWRRARARSSAAAIRASWPASPATSTRCSWVERRARRTLPRHARQSRPQPEDPAGGDALESAGSRPPRRRSARRSTAWRGIIEHQLKRAAASGGALLGRRRWTSPPSPRNCVVALLKVYARKDLVIELDVPSRGAVPRRPRRSHRAARQPARQRLQVVHGAGASLRRRRRGGAGRASGCASWSRTMVRGSRPRTARA